MLDITLKVQNNNILRLVITYQSERKTDRNAGAKFFYEDGDLRIVSAGCPDVSGWTIFLQGSVTDDDNNVLRFPNFVLLKKFFTALRTCTGNLRVEL